MLVIRVKRNREDDPAETLCLLEDNGASLPPRKKKASVNSLANQLASIGGVSSNSVNKEITTASHTEATASANDKGLENRKKLILHRVSTISVFDKQTIDNDTISALHDKNRPIESAQENSQPNKKSKVILTQSKKALPIQGQESCIIVDMMQIYNNTSNTADANNALSPTKVIPGSISTNTTPTKVTKILDPPTRMLSRGILTAIQRGDFNDISSALIQGANPNCQLDVAQGGYTALMAAVMKANIRMVKRLLLSEVNVLAKSKEEFYAIDYIKETAYNKKDCMEIKSLLQAAMVKAFSEQSYFQQQEQQQQLVGKKRYEDQYVVDIYCVQTTTTTNVQEEEQLPMVESEELESIPSSTMMLSPAVTADIHHPIIPTSASIITIEGLKILDDGLGVELLAYDSDWSDLADDEDPDSNDERHYANDYPEESDEDGGGGWFTQTGAGGRGEDGEDDEDAEDAGIFGYSATGHLHHPQAGKGQKKKKKKAKHAGRNADEDSEEEEQSEEGDGGGGGYDSENSDYDLLNEPADHQFRGRKVQFAVPKQPHTAHPLDETTSSSYHMTPTSNAYAQQRQEQAELEELETIFEDGQHRKPIFDRPNAVGRILRPHIFNDESEGSTAMANATANAPDSDMLRALWNEDVAMDITPEGGGGGESVAAAGVAAAAHTQRVYEMRERTGMLFASNPREFTASGLPKYGMDLSDDEVDIQYYQRSGLAMQGSGKGQSEEQQRPGKQMIAYDSELDRSDDSDA